MAVLGCTVVISIAKDPCASVSQGLVALTFRTGKILELKTAIDLAFFRHLALLASTPAAIGPRVISAIRLIIFLICAGPIYAFFASALAISKAYFSLAKVDEGTWTLCIARTVSAFPSLAVS